MFSVVSIFVTAVSPNRKHPARIERQRPFVHPDTAPRPRPPPPQVHADRDPVRPGHRIPTAASREKWRALPRNTRQRWLPAGGCRCCARRSPARECEPLTPKGKSAPTVWRKSRRLQPARLPQPRVNPSHTLANRERSCERPLFTFAIRPATPHTRGTQPPSRGSARREPKKEPDVRR
jgi:hypothetical protein